VLARVGTTRRGLPPSSSRWRRKAPIASWLWYSSGRGGIVSRASSVSRATISSTSPYPEWQNTQLIEGDVPEAVAELKSSPVRA
jgi:hypothetical protein